MEDPQETIDLLIFVQKHYKKLIPEKHIQVRVCTMYSSKGFPVLKQKIKPKFVDTCNTLQKWCYKMALSLFPFAIPFAYKNVVSATNYITTRYISRLLTFPWGVLVLWENWVIGGA